MSAARCVVAGCANFGSAARGGMCSGCGAGRPPAEDPGRVTAAAAAALARTEPDEAAVVEAKLARSLAVARAYADDFNTAADPAAAVQPVPGAAAGGSRGVPFGAQRKVEGEELAFHVAGCVPACKAAPAGAIAAAVSCAACGGRAVVDAPCAPLIARGGLCARCAIDLDAVSAASCASTLLFWFFRS